MKLQLLAIISAFLIGIAAGVLWITASRPRTGASVRSSDSGSKIAHSFYLDLETDLQSRRNDWHSGPKEGMGYFGRGDSSFASVRTNSCAAVGLAVLAGETSPVQDRSQHTHLVISVAANSAQAQSNAAAQMNATRAVELIRFLSYSHRVGGGQSTDGGTWGGNDNGAVDAANLGISAVLVESAIDSATFNKVSDVVRFEAERYLFTSPLQGSSPDSAAISNAAASRILVTAAMLFSSGEARVAYQRRASVFLASILTTSADASMHSSNFEPTLFPDLTLQFGGAFSASAELQVIGAIAWCDLVYRMVDQPAPPELEQHVVDCWRRVLVRLAMSDGWFLSGGGGLTSGGIALSWLATGLQDPKAAEIERAEIRRMARYPSQQGESDETALASTRIGDLAGRALIYRLGHGSATALPASGSVLETGVTWLRTASLAINRSGQAVVSYDWGVAAGQLWQVGSSEHVQWRLLPATPAASSVGTSGASPVWLVTSDAFSTTGSLHLENGVVQGAVCALPGGAVVLIERSETAGASAGLALFENEANAEPDLYRDDETGSISSVVRWANLDNRIGILVSSGTVKSEAAAGVLNSGSARSSWPLLKVIPDHDRAAIVSLFPGQTWHDTREIAQGERPMNFAGPGWDGAIIEPQPGLEYLVYARFGGSTAMLIAPSTPLGAPVLAEEGLVTGSMSSIPLSSPEGTARWEPITCWVSTGPGATLDARQGAELNTAIFENSGQTTAAAGVRFRSSGRSAVLTGSEGRVIARVPARSGIGEMHFFLSPGHLAQLSY